MQSIQNWFVLCRRVYKKSRIDNYSRTDKKHRRKIDRENGGNNRKNSRRNGYPYMGRSYYYSQ